MLLLQFSLFNIGSKSQALYIINDLVKKKKKKKKKKKGNRPMWT